MLFGHENESIEIKSALITACHSWHFFMGCDFLLSTFLPLNIVYSTVDYNWCLCPLANSEFSNVHRMLLVFINIFARIVFPYSFYFAANSVATTHSFLSTWTVCLFIFGMEKLVSYCTAITFWEGWDLVSDCWPIQNESECNEKQIGNEKVYLANYFDLMTVKYTKVCRLLLGFFLEG